MLGTYVIMKKLKAGSALNELTVQSEETHHA